MARGRRTGRSQAHRDALAAYGYPSDQSLRREAKHIARASAPTVRSIERPYDRQLQSAKDFLAAVRGALSDTSAGVNAAYGNALSQSQAVNQAAASRLSGLGLGDYSAGTQAVSGALGDSAAQQLISNAASARNYASQLPGIAAGNASVIAEGLRKQQQDALQNRRDQVRQAFWQALPQVQGQALQRASFNQSANQFAQNMALQEAQMAQQASQWQQGFNYQKKQDQRSYNMQAAGLLARYGFDLKTGRFVDTGQGGGTIQGLSHKYGLTPNEITTLQTHTTTQVEQLLQRGYSWKEAIQRAEANGVPPEIARLSVMSIYSNPPPLPSKPQPPNPQGYTDGKNDPSYVKDMATYQDSYTQWKAIAARYNAQLKQFKVQVLWRQLQRMFDAYMHPPTTNTEH